MDEQTVPKKRVYRKGLTHAERRAICRDRDRANHARKRAAQLQAMTPQQRKASLAQARPSTVLHDGRRVIAPSLPDAWCAWCTAIFRPKRKDRVTFCSRDCAQLHQGARRRALGLPKAAAGASYSTHKRRARHFGCVYERFDPVTVFERDRWTCQDCGRPTPRGSRGQMRDDAPTLDHRIPLALKGPHTPENTRCLCLPCNLKKGARTAP